MFYILFFRFIIKENAERISSCFIKRNHVLLYLKWNWIQKFIPQNIVSKKKKILEYVIDETLIKVGSEYVWLDWVAIEPWNKRIL